MIKVVLKRKVEEWLSSITDPHLVELLKKNIIVTGGSIVSMLLKEKVKDFDVYFRTKEVAKAVADYYVALFKKNPPSRFVPGYRKGDDIPITVEEFVDWRANERIRINIKSAGIASSQGTSDYQYFEQNLDPETNDAGEYVDQAIQVAEDEAKADVAEKFRPVFLSANAIMLTDKMQLVIRFWGEPEEIHKNYDFVHCTCWWDSATGKLELPAEALKAILTKELRYVGSLYPVCSIIRTRKFVQRGWYINAGQFLKMIFQCGQLELTNLKVLEDQLTGVDAAYFTEVINKLREKMETEDAKTIDQTYLMEIIDRIF